MRKGDRHASFSSPICMGEMGDPWFRILCLALSCWLVRYLWQALQCSSWWSWICCKAPWWGWWWRLRRDRARHQSSHPLPRHPRLVRNPLAGNFELRCLPQGRRVQEIPIRLILLPYLMEEKAHLRWGSIWMARVSQIWAQWDAIWGARTEPSFQNFKMMRYDINSACYEKVERG